MPDEERKTIPRKPETLERMERIREELRKKPTATIRELATGTGLTINIVQNIIRRYSAEVGWTNNIDERYRHRTEEEMFQIQRAAEAEGFGANNYGAFMAAIGYNWEGYQRGGMQRCSVRMRQEEG